MSNLQVERWTYMGTRRGDEFTTTKRAKLYAWLDKDGVERSYSKLVGSVIGGIYEIEVDRSEPDVVATMASTRKFTGKRYDDLDDENYTRRGMVAGWQVMDRLTDETIRRDRMERQAKADNDKLFEEAMEPLRKLYNVYTHTRADRHAFQAMVLSALNGW